MMLGYIYIRETIRLFYKNIVAEHNSHRFWSIHLSCGTNRHRDMRHLILTADALFGTTECQESPECLSLVKSAVMFNLFYIVILFINTIHI